MTRRRPTVAYTCLHLPTLAYTAVMLDAEAGLAQLQPERGEPIPLACWSELGRAPGCWAVLRGDDSISRRHAILHWRAGAWQVRDVSVNGCYLRGRALPAHEDAPLREGDHLRLGPAHRYRLVDLAAPAAGALEVDGKRRLLGDPDCVQLPGHVTIRRRPTGWICRQGEQERPVRHDERLRAGGGTWRLFLPDAATITRRRRPARRLDRITLELRASHDLEHVGLTLVDRGEREDLGTSQVWYLLYVLARARRDAEDPADGWVDIERLETLVAMPRRRIDVYVTRARKRLVDCGVVDGREVVQSRRGQRRLGLPPDRVRLPPEP